MFGINAQRIVRDVEVGRYFENILVSSFFSILFIRAYLRIFGYPLVGVGDVHVAHMLFGGIIMLLAYIPVVSFLNRDIKQISTVVFGIGFGMFIDEVGKFITRDNNYFFQPAIAIVYITFILLFLIFKLIEKKIKVTPNEYAINALDFTKEAILHDFDIQEKKLTLQLIRRSGLDNPILVDLEKNLRATHAKDLQKNNIFIRIRIIFRRVYSWLVQNKLLSKIVVIIFTINTAVSFANLLVNLKYKAGFFEWGEMVATLISAFFVVIGIYFLNIGKRLRGYEFLKLAVFASIFLRQFFIFYREQLSAVIGLSADILLLSMLQYIISQSTLKIKKSKDPLKDLREILYLGK